jgi:hypothetical protein
MIMHQELQVHKKISSLNSLHSSANYLKVRGANLIKIKANSPAHIQSFYGRRFAFWEQKAENPLARSPRRGRVPNLNRARTRLPE